MNKHQILGIRTYVDKDGKEKKAERFFNENWRADSVQSVLVSPEKYLEQIPHGEHYNLFVTLAQCLEERGRKLSEQWVIPFDIDGIDYNYLDQYCDAVCTALEITFTKTGFVATGNGLHVLVGIERPILDVEFFERNRVAYKELCMRIELALRAANLPFKEVDTNIFASGFMTRIPGTVNRKEGMVDKVVKSLNSFIVPIDFDLRERAGLVETDVTQSITKVELKEHFKSTPADSKAVLSDCPFMVYAQTATLTERQWYNALSIAVHLPSGMKVAHEISSHDKRYSQRETTLKAEQALERSGPVKCSTICKTFDGCSLCPHFGKITSPITLKGEEFIASKENGFRSMSEKGPGRIIYTDLIKFYQQKNIIKTEPKSESIFRFNGEFWEVVPSVDIEKFAYNHIKPTPVSHECKEFFNQLCYGEIMDLDWFISSTRGYMNFKNGILNLGSWELTPHSPDFGFTSVIPFDFDKEAKCPLWERTINKITVNRAELGSVLQEFAGYALSGSECRWHKALVLSGEGENGKSTFMETLMYCIGKNNYSSLPFHTVVTEKENTNMAHKLVNFTEEVGTKEFLNVSAPMKNLISGGEYRIRDLYQKGYEIKNRTKFILACNKLPKTNDTSRGFMRRLIIVPFEAVITKETDKDFDYFLQDKLYKEAAGIINWMIEGWVRLRDKGFTESYIMQNSLDEYMHDNDSIISFSKESLEMKIEAVTPKASAYTAYVRYCKDNGLMSKASPEFYKQLKRMYPTILYSRKRVAKHTNPVHCIVNLELTTDLSTPF